MISGWGKEFFNLSLKNKENSNTLAVIKKEKTKQMHRNRTNSNNGEGGFSLVHILKENLDTHIFLYIYSLGAERMEIKMFLWTQQFSVSLSELSSRSETKI